MCKGEKGGASKGVEAQGGNFLTRSGVSSGEVENFKKSHVAVSNDHVGTVLESSAQFCIPTPVALRCCFHTLFSLIASHCSFEM